MKLQYSIILCLLFLVSCNSVPKMASFYNENKDSLKKLDLMCVNFNRGLEYPQQATIIRPGRNGKILVRISTGQSQQADVTFNPNDFSFDSSMKTSPIWPLINMPKDVECTLKSYELQQIVRLTCKLKLHGVRFDKGSVFFSLGDRIKAHNMVDEGGILFLDEHGESSLSAPTVLRKLDPDIYLDDHFMEM